MGITVSEQEWRLVRVIILQHLPSGPKDLGRDVALTGVEECLDLPRQDM